MSANYEYKLVHELRNANSKKITIIRLDASDQHEPHTKHHKFHILIAVAQWPAATAVTATNKKRALFR